MKSKWSRYITPLAVLSIILSAILPLGAGLAAEDIYVDNASNKLGVPLSSAYAVGSGGSVSVVGDTYVLTSSGVVKIGQTAKPVPGGEPDGTTIKITTTIAKIGLYYISTNRDTALEAANLENSAGSGYKFGYYDSDRNFVELGSTSETKITMRPTGSGREVAVYVTGTDTLLYHHTNGSVNLAVRPVNQSGKAITWFKSNKYYGDFEYFRYEGRSKLTVINVVDVEDYVKGVIIREMSSSWPTEALKAQAVCARTYFASNVNSYSKYGFDITCDTASQAYSGTIGATVSSDNAAESTSGVYATYNGKFCETLYYSANGGGSENNENVNYAVVPYLKGVIDPYEKDAASINKYSSWTKTISKASISQKINASGKSFGTFHSMEATYSDTNNVIGLKFTDTSGKVVEYTKYNCFNFVYSTAESPSRLSLLSIHFTFEDKGDSIVFTGSGWGHSVGMSQFGAYAMAQHHGFNYLQILRYYYTGVSISTGIL